MSDAATAKKADDKPGGQPKSGAGSSGAGKLPGAADFDLDKGPVKAADGKPSSEKSSADAAAPSGGAAGPKPAVSTEEHERNEVFGSLVTGDDDIVGLVAYSIYKQNKHDWLVSFNKAKGREPNETEAGSYILGESTARRLEIYRHLAQATLEGKGPQVSGGPAKEKFVQHSLANGNAATQGHGGGLKALWWIIAAIAIAAAFYLGAKYGLPGVQS